MLSPERSRVLAQAWWGVQHEPAIHYAETRPIPLAAWRAGRLPLTTDCSGFVTCCYYAAGAADPNGLSYSGQGYTGSMLDHLPHIGATQAEPGDLLVFGAPPGLHVVILAEQPGMAYSHGTEAGPQLETLAGLRSYFAGKPETYLRGLPVSPPPPPPPHLTWRVLEGGHSIYRGTGLPAALLVVAAQARKHQATKGWSIVLDRIEVP